MIAWLIALALAAQPTAEAEALAKRLAQAGTLATIAPALTEKDIAELVADHPELSAADREGLRATARRVARADIDRVTAALGHAYAERLSLADLTVLVAAAESDAAKRRRAIEPAALMAAMSSLGAIDIKSESIAAFCRETGKACPTK